MKLFPAAFALLAATAGVTGAAEPKIALGHFRPAAAEAEVRYTCDGGQHRAVARHAVTLENGAPRARVVAMEASRALDAAELARVNGLLGGSNIVGISAGCLDGSVQFVISTWSAESAEPGAVMVTIGRDGGFKLL